MAAIFQTKFWNGWNGWILIRISLKFVSNGFKWQYSNIVADNGLVSIRREAIIWTNDGLVYWRIYAVLGLSELSQIVANHFLIFNNNDIIFPEIPVILHVLSRILAAMKIKQAKMLSERFAMFRITFFWEYYYLAPSSISWQSYSITLTIFELIKNGT